MAARSPPIGLDHPTVVPTNLHAPDRGRQSDRDDSSGVDDEADEHDC